MSEYIQYDSIEQRLVIHRLAIEWEYMKGSLRKNSYQKTNTHEASSNAIL